MKPSAPKRILVMCLLQTISIEAANQTADQEPAVRGEASVNLMHETIETKSTEDGKLDAVHVGVSVDANGRSQTVKDTRIIRDHTPHDTIPDHNDHASPSLVTRRTKRKASSLASAVLTAQDLGPIDGATPVRPNTTTNMSAVSPSDYQAQALTPIVAFCTYTAGVVVMVGVTVGIYSQRGFFAVVVILTYIMSLSSMTLTIRNLFVGTPFSFPRWVSASHFICTFIVGFLMLLHRRARDATPIVVPTPGQFLSNILPVAIALASSIGFANLGLLHANAHFYEMVGATTPLATAGLNAFTGKAFNVRLVPPSLLIAFGLAICAMYEVAFSWVGFSFCCAAVLCRAIKSTVQNVLLQSEGNRIQLEPLELLVWTSLPCALVMALWSFVQEGIEPYHMVLAKKSTAVALLYTILNACILNTSALYVLRDLGPLAQQIAVQLKGILAILGSVWLFNEITAMNQIGGYMCMVVGIYWYNRREYTMKQPQQATTQNEEGQSENSAAARRAG